MVSPTIDRRMGLVGNVGWKAPVTVLAASNITLSGEQTIDNVAVLAENAAGVPDRVLCVNQTDATENGIWDVSTTAWSRSKDANGNYDLGEGSTALVNQGTTYAGTYWKITNTGVITIGTTEITWSRALASTLPTLSEWLVFSGTPTRISGTSFSVTGDQTATFQIGRRLKSSNTAGFIYSTISNSSFGAGITTVTVVNDSGSLDTGLSEVFPGVLSVTNPSVPHALNFVSLAWTMTTNRILGRTTASTGAVEELTGAQSAGIVGGGINGLTTDSAPNTTDDYVMTYDASASAAKKVTLGDLTNGSFRTYQRFVANGTYTKPAGLKRVKVTLVGGGGGGGGAPATAGGQCSAGTGGAAGGACVKIIAAGSIGATESVTVGTAGAGGVPGVSLATAGGTTSFGSHCQATGGALGTIGAATAGVGGQASGTAGGVGSSGDLDVAGGSGKPGMVFTTNAIGGEGGNSILGGGARSPQTTTTSAGVAAGNYGGGGSGAANGPSQSAATGGAGSSGLVLVEEFY